MEQQINSDNQTPTPDPSSRIPNRPTNGESWVAEYYTAVKAGFMRVWLSRYLWFWGIFLPAGFGINANYNFNSRDFADKNADSYARNFFADMESFFFEHEVWIILGALLFLAVAALLWTLSAVARSGVVQALDSLQNPKAGAVHTFRTVWRQGRQRFAPVMAIDVVIGFSMMLILVILATPIILLVVQGRFAGAALLGLLAFLIYIPLVLLSVFLRQIGMIIVVLSKVPAINAIENAYAYVRGNLKEALKLLLAMVVLGIIQGLAAFAAAFPMAVAAIGAVALLTGFFGRNVFADPVGRAMSIAATALVILLLLAIFLFIKSIFSLWVQDLWLWWTKKVGSATSVDTGRDKIKTEEAVKGKALTGAEEG